MPSLPIKSFVIISFVVIIFLFDNLTIFLVYDRDAILEGEVWRLLTGHLVHFSVWHAGLNILVFVIVGWIIEQKGYPGYGLLMLLISFVIGISLIVFEPDMKFYGGMSGIAYGTLIYLTLFGLEESKPWPDFSRLIFMLVLIKALTEFYFDSSLTNVDKFHPVPLSHMIGIVIAVIQFYTFKLIDYKHGISELK